MIIVFCAYSITAIYGYSTFGSAVDDDLLKSYNSKDATVLIAIVMFLIKTYTSYPLNLFCARYQRLEKNYNLSLNKFYNSFFRTAIEGLWIEIFRLNSNAIIKYEARRRFIIVTFWYILSLAIALFLPNISVVIRYMGALAGTFMFIFPGLCLLFIAIERNDYSNKTIFIYSLSFMYIVVGAFIMGLVLTQSIYKDFN